MHLEQLGSLDGVARAKGELLAALPAQGAAVIPVGEPLLARLVAEGADTITFGPEGDVLLAGSPTRDWSRCSARR